ncbi:MAG: ester cyclase [Thiobacillaceae bacterium]
MNNPSDVLQRYFDAWNAHDAAGIVSTFTSDGVYQDPNTRAHGDEIGAYAQSLWVAFPDLSFEVVSKAGTDAGMVAAEWLMTGTNTGPFQGLPPSGNKVSLAGADFIKVSGGQIESVTGYFDTKVIPEQLGLQVLVQPSQVGPFSFGYRVFAQTGKLQKPGAFGITSIWNSAEDTEEIKNQSREIARELLHMDGFIGLALARAGGRGVTISAWEKPEDVRRIMQSPAHSDAMKRFWDSLSDAAFTSVWVPDHINPLWVRCTECRRMNNHEEKNGQCTCGSKLPDPPPYF